MTPDFTAEDQARWFARLASMRDYLIWGLMCDAVPVGAMGLKHVTQMQAEYWGYLGDRQYWGLGLGQEMVRFGLTQARKLGLAELYLKVHQDNTRAIRLYTKAGFRPTAQLGAVLEMRRPVADSHE
ncbi:FdtC [Verrucomicrobia bacterium]|nr:FdtC [Verrucomicrobiota bacterium]